MNRESNGNFRQVKSEENGNLRLVRPWAVNAAFPLPIASWAAAQTMEIEIKAHTNTLKVWKTERKRSTSFWKWLQWQHQQAPTMAIFIRLVATTTSVQPVLESSLLVSETTTTKTSNPATKLLEGNLPPPLYKFTCASVPFQRKIYKNCYEFEGKLYWGAAN